MKKNFEYNGKRYYIAVASIRTPGGIVTADDILADPELQGHLINIYSTKYPGESFDRNGVIKNLPADYKDDEGTVVIPVGGFEPVPVESGDRKYVIVLPSFTLDGVRHTAEALAQDQGRLDQLIARAWKGRDESTFNRNGIFRLVYDDVAAPEVIDIDTEEGVNTDNNTGEETHTEGVENTDTGTDEGTQTEEGKTADNGTGEGTQKID